MADTSAKLTELIEAVEKNDIQAVTTIVQSDQVGISQKNKWGLTALHVAAACGFNGVVRVLLENFANPDAQTILGWTPLHDAAFEGHAGVVKQLIDGKAEINAENDEGDTPLHEAVRAEHANVVEVLVKHGASLLHVNDRGDTALHAAVVVGELPVVRMLLEHGALPQARNQLRLSPMDLASETGPEVLKLVEEFVVTPEPTQPKDQPKTLSPLKIKPPGATRPPDKTKLSTTTIAQTKQASTPTIVGTTTPTQTPTQTQSQTPTQTPTPTQTKPTQPPTQPPRLQSEPEVVLKEEQATVVADEQDIEKLHKQVKHQQKQKDQKIQQLKQQQKKELDDRQISLVPSMKKPSTTSATSTKDDEKRIKKEKQAAEKEKKKQDKEKRKSIADDKKREKLELKKTKKKKSSKMTEKETLTGVSFARPHNQFDDDDDNSLNNGNTTNTTNTNRTDGFVKQQRASTSTQGSEAPVHSRLLSSTTLGAQSLLTLSSQSFHVPPTGGKNLASTKAIIRIQKSVKKQETKLKQQSASKRNSEGVVTIVASPTGVDLKLTRDAEGRLRVFDTTPRGAADCAGVLPGDIIFKIGGVTVAPSLSILEVCNLLDDKTGNETLVERKACKDPVLKPKSRLNPRTSSSKTRPTYLTVVVRANKDGTLGFVVKGPADGGGVIVQCDDPKQPVTTGDIILGVMGEKINAQNFEKLLTQMGSKFTMDIVKFVS